MHRACVIDIRGVTLGDVFHRLAVNLTSRHSSVEEICRANAFCGIWEIFVTVIFPRADRACAAGSTCISRS